MQSSDSSLRQDEAPGQLFAELKSMCVPLLTHSRIDNRATPKVLSLLSDLIKHLQKLDKEQVEMKPALISYVFFPLSMILSRNDFSNIPDQVLERIFIVLELLFRWWWWICEEGIWEQVLILASSVTGGFGGKGKTRERDDETKEAAARLLLCLLRDRATDDKIVEKGPGEVEKAHIRFKVFQTHAQSEKLVPILGQTLNTLLFTSTSEHLPLQLCSLQTIETIILLYIPDVVVPSILPGVVSTATRIALGRTADMPKGKGWVNGVVVSASLRVLDVVVTRSLSDDACISSGVVKEIYGLEDLTELVSGDAAVSLPSQSESNTKHLYETARSVEWLRASSSQLLIALNTLSPLISHPTPAALLALSSFSESILSKTRLTLPDARYLLLSFLLSLSNVRFPSVSIHARTALSTLITPPAKGSHELLQTLLQQTAENLASLPQLLLAHADGKIEFVAGQIEAVCRLRIASAGVGRLLGPTGHIEKWGWRLLAVLEFAPLSSISTSGTKVSGLLESTENERIVFPSATSRLVATRDTHAALERMLRALGAAGGEICLFAVEWFVRVGVAQRGSVSSVAALWCACRILEGVVNVTLDDDENTEVNNKKGVKGRRVEKHARWLAKAVSELWDNENYIEDEKQSAPVDDSSDVRPTIEYVKGLTPLQTRFDIKPNSRSTENRPSQPILHKSFALQLLAVSAAILQSRFTTLLIHALYPLLYSLVSSDTHLAGTAYAAFQYVTRNLGYATPGNLLLANFDYALDSASRRLTRRWLDIDAARVLAVLVRIVGRDVVQRAGDVVEECFDRLDDFHGYALVVEGLVEALHEVVKVIEAEEIPPANIGTLPEDAAKIPDKKRFDDFLVWIEQRNEPLVQEEDQEEFGPVPQDAWGKGKSKEMSAEEEEERRLLNESDTLADPPPTPTQALTAQIVTRSISLLTHGSPSIRARILTLLASAAPVLPASALLPAVHRAWPFILNRLGDTQTPVVAAAAAFVAALSQAHGQYMTPRVWDDVWPRFRSTLAALERADATNALARRTRQGNVGTESAYTHSHRLYRAMLGTMTAALRGGMQVQDRRSWDVLVAFRRFLHKDAHEELQAAAHDLYVAFGKNNEDAVWLVLTSTVSIHGTSHLKHLEQTKWDVKQNVDSIMAELSNI